MAERYGTDLSGLGGFEGGVTSENGAALVSTSSDGETALLFGPAALREIQAGVANGDFSIVPDDSTGTITDANPLPYWTFTDDDSAGAITCAVVAGTAGNSVLWTVAANTTTGKTATLSRYVAVPATQDKAYAFYPEFYLSSATNTTSRNIIFTLQYYTAAFVTTGTAITRTYPFSDFTSGRSAVFLFADTSARLQVPDNARFAKISIQVDTTGTNASASTISLFEVKMLTAYPMLLAADRKDAGTSGPGAIWKSNGVLNISADIPTTWTTGTLSATGPLIKVGTSVLSLTASTFSGQITGLSGADITGLLYADRMTAGNVKSGVALVTVTANVVSSVSITSVGLVTSNASAGVNDVSVVASQGSTRPDLLRAVTIANQTFSGANMTGFTAYIFRTNSTDTSVYWIATGR